MKRRNNRRKPEMNSTQTKLQPVPYLTFNGNCREAMHFYADLFGGKIRSIMTGKETPVANEMPPEYLEGVMNATLELPGGMLLMGSDNPSCYPYEPVKGLSLALSFDTVSDAESIFAKLAEGGQVTMPMEPTFWAKKFGMVTDKFGIPWIINGELLMDEHV